MRKTKRVIGWIGDYCHYLIKFSPVFALVVVALYSMPGTLVVMTPVLTR